MLKIAQTKKIKAAVEEMNKKIETEDEKPVKMEEKDSNEAELKVKKANIGAEEGASTQDLADLKAKIKAVVELKVKLEAEREASTQYLADVKAKIKAGDELKAQLEAELNAKEKTEEKANIETELKA